MKNLFFSLIFGLFCLTLSAQTIDSDIKQKNLIKTLKVLTSDRMKGRESGSGYDIKAARYIERKMSRMGYKPLLGDDALVEFDIPNSDNKGYNVVMVLKSNNPKAQNILMGAHYDHLGVAKEDDSFEEVSKGDIYRGANDNASGVATLLEAARVAAEDVSKNRHNLIICAFGAEEMGIIGASDLSDKLEANGIKVDFMINFEMTGSLDDRGNVEVLGNNTFNMHEYLKRIDNKDSLILNELSVYTHFSDHIEFTNGNGVAVFATTDIKFYHHPKDDISLINFDGMSKIARFASNFLKTLLYDEVLPVGKRARAR